MFLDQRQYLVRLAEVERVHHHTHHARIHRTPHYAVGHAIELPTAQMAGTVEQLRTSGSSDIGGSMASSRIGRIGGSSGDCEVWRVE